MTSQPDEVLELLRQHPVRPLQAWVELGCYRLADAVHKLRKRGHVIGTRMVPYKRPDGRVIEFAEYVLVKEAE